MKENLKEFKEEFEEVAEEIKEVIDEGEDIIQLTYGKIPVFRSLFSPELDKRFMELSAEDRLEVYWFFDEDFRDELSDEGITMWGDLGDGTVVWVGTGEGYERYMGDLGE